MHHLCFKYFTKSTIAISLSYYLAFLYIILIIITFSKLFVIFRFCMAVSFLAHKVSDLCLAKPALRSLSVSTTIADALTALKNSEDSFISVWDCNHSGNSNADSSAGECRCIGKLCMVDVICYLCKEENLLSPSDSLKASVSHILPKIPGSNIMHVEPSCSLLEAIDLILEGVQNLVVPIRTRVSSNLRRKQNPKGLLANTTTTTTTIHNGLEFCWLTQEDVVRFLLSSIGLFSPTPALSIDTLGIINTNLLAINYHSPASSAIQLISHSLIHQTSVAVIDQDGILIGEISPFTLSCCDETVSAAITTLSSGGLMAYIDCGGPPDDLVKVVKQRLKEMNLESMFEEFSITNSTILTSSCNEDCCLSTKGLRSRLRRHRKYASYSSRMGTRVEAIVCHPKSSLLAVMIQAIAHRVNYVWVIEDDCSLVGIVTFFDMLKVFREHLDTMMK